MDKIESESFSYFESFNVRWGDKKESLESSPVLKPQSNLLFHSHRATFNKIFDLLCTILCEVNITLAEQYCNIQREEYFDNDLGTISKIFSKTAILKPINMLKSEKLSQNNSVMESLKVNKLAMDWFLRDKETNPLQDC